MVGKSIQCDVNVDIVLLFIKYSVIIIEIDDIQNFVYVKCSLC